MWEQYIGGKCIDREVSKYSWLAGYRNNTVNASEETLYMQEIGTTFEFGTSLICFFFFLRIEDSLDGERK